MLESMDKKMEKGLKINNYIYFVLFVFKKLQIKKLNLLLFFYYLA